MKNASRATGHAPYSPNRLRLTMADHLIASEKSRGTVRTEEEIYADAGFPSADEYWADAISEQSGFAHRLTIHFLNPRLRFVDLHKMDLEDALCVAVANGEPWIREKDGKKIVLRPRDAVDWLLSQPTRKHLIPPGLKAFLERSQSPSATDRKRKSPGKRGHPRPKTDRIIKEMMLMDRDELEGLFQKEMVVKFKAVRSTCQAARKIVLSMKSRST
jgi:hypothetical protein